MVAAAAADDDVALFDAGAVEIDGPFDGGDREAAAGGGHERPGHRVIGVEDGDVAAGLVGDMVALEADVLIP
nr:hypothetical protein [Tepidiforma sp.]